MLAFRAIGTGLMAKYGCQFNSNKQARKIPCTLYSTLFDDSAFWCQHCPHPQPTYTNAAKQTLQHRVPPLSSPPFCCCSCCTTPEIPNHWTEKRASSLHSAHSKLFVFSGEFNTNSLLERMHRPNANCLVCNIIQTMCERFCHNGKKLRHRRKWIRHCHRHILSIRSNNF